MKNYLYKYEAIEPAFKDFNDAAIHVPSAKLMLFKMASRKWDIEECKFELRVDKCVKHGIESTAPTIALYILKGNKIR